jgi:prepilin-type N-terminal cleavage/methylation domain-containing protein
MITPRHDSRRARGFTLLEVLLAVAVFSIVLIAIHSVFFSALRLRNRTVEVVEKTVPIGQTVAIIQQDLANIVLPGTNMLFGPFQTTPTQTSGSQNNALQTGGLPTGGTPTGQTAGMIAGRSSPVFYTSTGVIDLNSPFADVQKVSYFLAPSTNNTPGMDLYRAVTRNLLPVLTEESVDQFLMSGVEEINFFFYDGNGWVDTWDSTTPDSATGLTNSLPQAIKVQIQLTGDQPTSTAGAPVEIVVPLLVQVSTNQTALN